MSLESIPQSWTESDDEYFAIVARLFTTQFTAGASVLLASFDGEPVTDTEVIGFAVSVRVTALSAALG